MGDTFSFTGTEFSTTALLSGDTVSSVSLASAGAASDVGVGAYDITASNAVGTGLSNYDITYAKGTLTVQNTGVTLIYHADSGGTISGTTPQTVPSGGSGTLVTAVPSAGHHFSSWSDGFPTAARTDVGVTASKEVTATFGINHYTLTYAAGPNGTVTGASPQTVDYNGTGTQVTAVPAVGYHFVNWSDGVATASRTDHSIAGNISVIANFENQMMPIWRFRKLNAVGFYLWTADPAEKANIQATLAKKWFYEGPAFVVNSDNPKNDATLWRFRNLKSGTYLYTADPNEKYSIIANQYKVWKYEGPTWNVSNNPVGTLPVWRFRCLKNTTYLWTSDPSEKQSIEDNQKGVYKLDGASGVAYYIGQ